MHNNQDEVDPEVLDLLDLLRETPQRDPQASAHSRDRFMAELDTMYPEPVTAQPQMLAWFPFLRHLRQNLSLAGIARPAWIALTAILVVAVLLAVGSGATANASQGALPGDTLYPLKTGMEQARLSLTTDAEKQAALHMVYAENRLEEIQELVQDGRYEEVGSLAIEFQLETQSALLAVGRLAHTNPQRAAELNAQIAARLGEFAQALKQMAAGAPVQLQDTFQTAIGASESEQEDARDIQEGAPAGGEENQDEQSQDQIQSPSSQNGSQPLVATPTGAEDNNPAVDASGGDTSPAENNHKDDNSTDSGNGNHIDSGNTGSDQSTGSDNSAADGSGESGSGSEH